MANTTKVTKRDRYNALRAIVVERDDKELVEFIDHELQLLDKKSSSKSKAKNASINAELDARIVALLEEHEEGLTASQILKQVNVEGIEGLKELSLPKINNRLTAIGKEQKLIDRLQDKKTVLFKLGEGKGFKEKE